MRVARDSLEVELEPLVANCNTNTQPGFPFVACQDTHVMYTASRVSEPHKYHSPTLRKCVKARPQAASSPALSPDKGFLSQADQSALDRV